MKEKYHNFRLALQKLSQFITISRGSEIERAGVIQAFKFTYELCWHTLQKVAGAGGVQIASPKKAFEYAMQAGFILPDEEVLFIQMIKDRNQTTHTYREVLAAEILCRIERDYLSAFARIIERLSA